MTDNYIAEFSGKSSLVAQALPHILVPHLGGRTRGAAGTSPTEDDAPEEPIGAGTVTSGLEHFERVTIIDQKPIGRTPRSNLATYTGLGLGDRAGPRGRRRRRQCSRNRYPGRHR
jgi:excinuclease ABC subunit A